MIGFWISYVIVLFGLFLAKAKEEINIEGEKGWATGLPTWRLRVGCFITSEGEPRMLYSWKYAASWVIVKVIMGDRELTGYHFFFNLFVIFMIHLPLPYIIALDGFSWRWEALLWSIWPLLYLFEDFFWFLFNKTFGLRRFKREHIPWHPRWILGVPDCYWQYAGLAAIFIWLGLPALS